MRLTILFILTFFTALNAQDTHEIKGKVMAEGESLPNTNIYVETTTKGSTTDEDGFYNIKNLKPGTYSIAASFAGYTTQKKKVEVTNADVTLNFNLNYNESLDEVIITGTLKPVSRLESPVPVEVYTPTFLKKNPTPNIFEALQNVNGVRPQLNCSVCNTGDIHINGLEGPYTLVLIDGMPIVSGLSTVYGLSGIPNSLIEQIEVVKGPASYLYGSEAVGGLINVITKLPENAPIIFDTISKKLQILL